MSESKWAIEIGSRVHFVYGGQHVPAIITDPAFQDHGVDGQDEVRILQALTVFLPNAEPFTTVAEQMGEIAPGTWQNATWHWPEWMPVSYGDSDGGSDDGELCKASDVAGETKPYAPQVGDWVHFVLDEGRNKGEHRPALVVKTWGSPESPAPYVQLQVFTDSTNDGDMYAAGIVWRTSVQPDQEAKAPRTWHWPE